MPAASMKPKAKNTNGARAANDESRSNSVKDDTSNKDEYLDAKSISLAIIEKKIRNLVKRHDKLEDFQKKEENGIKLEKEQKEALSQIDDVARSIKMLKDISKNVTVSLNEFEKKQSKAQKKEENAEKAKQKAEDSSRLRVMYQMPFIARVFDKIRPVIEQEGKFENNYINAFSQLSALFNKYDHESLVVLERFFAGDSGVFVEEVSFASLKDGIFEMVASDFFKSFLEPEVGYVSFEQEQPPVNENVEPEINAIAPPVPIEMMHDVACNIENDMQSKDPAVLAVGHGFTFQGLPPHPVNGVAFMTQMPVFPHSHVPNDNFHMMNPTLPIESHVPVPVSEEEKNPPATDESKSDGASTPDGQVGNDASNRRGNFRGRGRAYFRGNRNYRNKIGFFNAKESNEDMNEAPDARGKEENREVKKRYNKPRPVRNEENGQPQNDQVKPQASRTEEQKPIPRNEPAKNVAVPNAETKVKPQIEGDSNENANSKKNFNGEKRTPWVKRPFNNNNNGNNNHSNNHPTENGDSVNYDKQHDGPRPYYNNNRGGYNRNGGFRGGRGGAFRNNNGFGNRPYQAQPQQNEQQQRS